MAARTRKTTAPADDDEVMLGDDPDAVVERAKATFSLEKRLSGMTLATARVLVFTDTDAVVAWQEQDRRVQRLALQVAATQEAGGQAHADARAGHDDADELLEELRAAAYKGALAVHMRAVPQVAAEAAQRKARNKYRDETGQVPAEDQEAFFEMQNTILLGQVVQRIVDADGNEADFNRARLADTLRNALPVPQYRRLIDAFNALMYNDSLARAATSDPGF